MKQETIKIQLLNDTQLSIRPVFPDGKTVVPVDDITNLRVSWGINGHEDEPMQEPTIFKKDGYLVIPISSTLPLGVYDVHIQGTIGNREVSDNRHAMFELVKYGNGIAYEQYYTEMVIIGLPDTYIEELRLQLEQKIADADAAYQAWVSKAQNIDGLAKQGNNPLATNTAIYDIVKQGGGGGITPEQYNALAKQQTLNEIKAMLTLADGEVTAELQTL